MTTLLLNDDGRRRRRLLAMIGAGLAVPAILREASAQGLVPAEQGLRQVRGDVRVNGAPAAIGAAVRPGDTVTTGPLSYAMFVVGGDAWLLRENSRADLSGRDAAVDLLRLVTGKVLGVFGKSSVRRSMSAATATIGIRGTGGYLETYPNRSLTYFCLCYGAAELDAGNVSETYTSLYHENPRLVRGDGAARRIERAPVINHSDSELVMLEGLVGRQPPQTFIDNVGRY